MDNAFWQSILEANGALPADHDMHALTDELLSYLGSPDAHLRDGVAYPLLAQWVSEGRYSRDDLRAMATRLTTNLQAGLGEDGTESVFLRAFSVLMLAELIHQENKRTIFEFAESDVRAILEAALAYLPAERDLRGYVPGSGWAHAVAHAADVLWVLASSRYLGAPDLEQRAAGEAAAVLERAYTLREALYSIFTALVYGSAPAPDDLDQLNGELERGMAGAHIIATADGFAWNWRRDEQALDQMLGPVARSAAHLLTSEE